ncbi:phospholipase A2 protein family [Aspergillus arachidicola]|uniref:Phospholipase A2 protein family n=1 Tax=Aspergillus arachidicola TaxID=656916 RepID=A0A2G7G1G9_9EURO|nr:phospholipase A2 protein family [Aspergillus arachidicola]
MLVIIEVLVTVASQFLSTILISDFMDSSFINSNNLTEVGIFRPLGFTEAAWWRVPPASSWTFGELAESFSQGPNFHDTGHTYRAFIPFQDEAQRTSLRSFQGPAAVMDQRVVCVSPSFVDLRLNSTFPPRLFGQMTLGNESYPILQNMETQGPINFTCALPFPSKNTTYGMSSLCYPLLALTSNIQLEDPLVNINPDDRIPLYSGYNNPLASPMLIVLDILDGVAMMARNLENITTPYRVTTLHKDGPWSIIMNGSNTAALRVSSCFTNLAAKTFTVDMASSWQNWEPRLSWDRKSNSFDTESVRRQLGASLTPDSLNHRGVLALNPRSEWEDFDMRINAIENDFNEFDTYFHFTTTFLNLLPTPQQALTPPDFPRANQGILLSEANTADTSTADRSYTDIFKDVLHDTNSPALALQALITRGTQAAYYENLMREDPIASALTAFSSTALIPARWDGFVAGLTGRPVVPTTQRRTEARQSTSKLFNEEAKDSNSTSLGVNKEVMASETVDATIAELLSTFNELNSHVVEELNEEPSPLEFMRFVARNTPFVVRGGASSWKACQEWNSAYLLKALKDQTVNVAVTPYGNADAPTQHPDYNFSVFAKPHYEDQPFDTFLEYVVRHETDPNFPQDAEVRYAQTQNDNLRDEYMALYSDVQKDIPFARIALDKAPDAVNLWIGNSKSVTAMHKDNYENIYVQVLGRKHFVLFPALCYPLVNEKPLRPATYIRTEDGLVLQMDDNDEPVPFPTWDPDRPSENTTPFSQYAQPLRVTLNPGDMLYLPAMWYHKVSQSCTEEDEGFVLAVNYWYDMEFSGPLFPTSAFIRDISLANTSQATQ